MNGGGKICWAGECFNCIKKVYGFIVRPERWAESLSGPWHCWVLCWNSTVTIGKEPCFPGRQRGWPPVCTHFTPMYLSVGLKNWSFRNCLTVLSLLMPWTSILNWGLDDIFMEVLKKLESFQCHFSSVCFLQNDTKRCFLSICRGTAHSYLYEKIMVTKILRAFFYWMLTL